MLDGGFWASSVLLKWHMNMLMNSRGGGGTVGHHSCAVNSGICSHCVGHIRTRNKLLPTRNNKFARLLG